MSDDLTASIQISLLSHRLATQPNSYFRIGDDYIREDSKGCKGSSCIWREDLIGAATARLRI